MNVDLDLDKSVCRITKTHDDIKYKSSGWAEAESTFLYHILQKLKEKGYDVIKKRMWRDGHLAEETQQYIRSRKIKTNSFFIHNADFSIYDAGFEFNDLPVGGSINLTLTKIY